MGERNERLRARLELRRSAAAERHRNRRREERRPGKGTRTQQRKAALREQGRA